MKTVETIFLYNRLTYFVWYESIILQLVQSLMLTIAQNGRRTHFQSSFCRNLFSLVLSLSHGNNYVLLSSSNLPQSGGKII